MEEEESENSLEENVAKDVREEIIKNKMKNEDAIDDFLAKRKYKKHSDITQNIRFIAGLDDFGLGIPKLGVEEIDDREEVNVEKNNNIIQHVSTEENDPNVEKKLC
jgi:hypothetical protein